MAIKWFSFSSIWKWSIMAVLLLLSACNLPATPGGNTGEPVDQGTRQAVAIQTLVSQGVAQTVAAMGTNTPEFTLKPSLTPSWTFTPTPEVVRVTVSVETNCRSGPGTKFDKVGVLPKGATAEAVGRSVTNDNWIIKLPSDPAVTCWLWFQYATVSGDWLALPVFTPPPTP